MSLSPQVPQGLRAARPASWPPTGAPGGAEDDGAAPTSPRPRPRRGFRPVLMGLAVGLGVVLGVLGTALHAGIWVLGETQGGLVLPWGAALALLICLLAQLWIGLRADSMLEPAVMGVVTFSLVTLTMMWPGADQLTVPYSQQAMARLPGPTTASLVWWLGSAGVTLASMVLVRWLTLREPLEPGPGGPGGTVTRG